MGRQIRMVPPNWNHPRTNKYGDNRYQPMFDKSYDEAAQEWMEDLKKWEAGERPDYFTEGDAKYVWDWYGMPPDKEYYNTFYTNEQATWYQVYETVSEGTPVSPPFAAQKELVNYLIHNGDFWNQKRGEGGYDREAAEEFVYGSGYAPTAVIQNGEVTMGINSCKNHKIKETECSEK